MKSDLDKETIERRLEQIQYCFEAQIKEKRASGHAFFSDSNGCKGYALVSSPPQLVVVADSFHIKPLLRERSLSRNLILITISSFKISAYQQSEGYVTKLFEKDIILQSDSKRMGFIGQKKRLKDQFQEKISTITKDFIKQLDFANSHYAILGSKVLRKSLRNEIEIVTKSRCLFDDQILTDYDAVFARMKKLIMDHTDEINTIEAEILRKRTDLEQTSLSEISKAAFQGRIDQFYVESDLLIWGKIDAVGQIKELHESQQDHEDDCVLDDIIQQVIKSDGKISFIDSRKTSLDKPFFAKFRW